MKYGRAFCLRASLAVAARSHASVAGLKAFTPPMSGSQASKTRRSLEGAAA